MKNFEIQFGIIPYMNDVINLYKDLKLDKYIDDYDRLKRILDNSIVVTAWFEDKLIGLLRLVGDDETIVYIHEVTVKKEYIDYEIGTYLLQAVCEKYRHVENIFLVCDNNQDIKEFLKKNEFNDLEEYGFKCFFKNNKSLL